MAKRKFWKVVLVRPVPRSRFLKKKKIYMKTKWECFVTLTTPNHFGEINKMARERGRGCNVDFVIPKNQGKF